MFTGIIETTGKVVASNLIDSNLYLQIESNISKELKIDQSVAHDGICLTVTHIESNTHTVCAVPETMQKTTIRNWRVGDTINLERCMRIHDRLDGHIVQGHVDTKASCIERKDHGDYWNFIFSIPDEFAGLIVEKGSIAINGISLTCFNVTNTSFEVAIIPYTYEFTNFNTLNDYTTVNIEFDIVGKYVARNLVLAGKAI
jgi:riboflavin synthase